MPAVIQLEGDFQEMVRDFSAEVLVEGMVHGDGEIRSARARAVRNGVELKTDGRAVIPKDAISFLESRRDLNRFFDPDQVEKVRTILGIALREGATVPQTMDALQTALPAASRARLENIARTEATAAYNQGRLSRFLQSKGFITAVRFLATMDSRVTDICQHRNGLVFALNDPRLRENTPPLHFQCRSILSPVSDYELQEMGGKERLEKDARAMDDAPGPQVTKKGRFGNEPWPEAPGGAAPVPRSKPVGPQAGGGQKPPGQPPVVRQPQPTSPRPVPTAAVPTREVAPRLDLLPASGSPANIPPRGAPWRPKESEHVGHSSGTSVYHHPGVPKQTSAKIIDTLDQLPEKVKETLCAAGAKTWFLTPEAAMSLEYRSGGPGQRVWEAMLTDIVQNGAGTLVNYPKPGDVTMVFVPNSIAQRRGSPFGWAARHEAGHAFHDSYWRLADKKRRRWLRDGLGRAFSSEGRRLGAIAETSEREFLAEGLAAYFEGRLGTLGRAQLLYRLVRGMMV